MIKIQIIQFVFFGVLVGIDQLTQSLKQCKYVTFAPIFVTFKATHQLKQTLYVNPKTYRRISQ